MYDVTSPEFAGGADRHGADSTAAFQALATVLSQTGGRGCVPPGDYTVSAQLQLPDFGWLEGEGPGVSTITWANDLGLLEAAIITGANTTSRCFSAVRGLTLVGPGDTFAALGSAPCAMSAVRLQAKGSLQDCEIYGWGSGWEFFGDHQRVVHVRAYDNAYGLWYPPGAESFGNQTVIDADLTGNKVASICVDGASTIDSSTFLAVHAGFSPYGLLKTNDMGYDKDIATNSTLDVWFEALGNGAIFDQGAAKAIDCNRFPSLSVMWNAAYRIADLPGDYAVVCGALTNNDIGANTNGVAAGAKGKVSASAWQGNVGAGAAALQPSVRRLS